MRIIQITFYTFGGAGNPSAPALKITVDINTCSSQCPTSEHILAKSAGEAVSCVDGLWLHMLMCQT